MNYFVVSLFFIFAACASAGEYRFQCLGEVTGLCDRVYEKDGNETTIKIDFADPESAAIFLALQKKRVYGTKGVEEHMGVRWEQGIYLVGEFTSETKHTKGGPTRAAAEPYRNFRATGIKVAFPVWLWQEAVVDYVDPPTFMETHFDFGTLFPKGLELKGKKIDLSKHVLAPADAVK